MPNYDYQCAQCGTFELWQSIKDQALRACPTCGSKVERLISASVGFVLKGQGSYQNDHQPRPHADGKQAPDAGPGCGACGSPDPCPGIN